jgi:hypothetical protein
MIGPTPPPLSLPHDRAVAMLETVLALAIQLIAADNPDLLLPPEVEVLRPSRRLVVAREIVALARETHFALERYRDVARPVPTYTTAEDDIPF